jgi:tRNA(Ile)-lysidine synthase TilS/MesJ
MKNDLKSKILAQNSSIDYDCVLLFSGGKDSTYLLYYLAEKLNLRVLTLTLVHDFLPQETINNIEKFSARFSKKHVNIKNNTLSHSGKHFLETWINKPDEGSLITLCTGCRIGLIKPVIDTAKKEKVNVVLAAHTPFESTEYKASLVNYPKGKKGFIYFALGYLRLLLRNPSLLKDIKAFISQLEEFYYYKNKESVFKNAGIEYIKPFYTDIEFNEYEVIKKLKELNWQRPETSRTSYWRSDCNMYAIRHYLYNQVAGYNESKEYYGNLLKNKQISQEYFDNQSDTNYAKEEILDILTSLELSESSINKYKDFLGKYGNHDVQYPSCSSCQRIP